MIRAITGIRKETAGKLVRGSRTLQHPIHREGSSLSYVCLGSEYQRFFATAAVQYQSNEMSLPPNLSFDYRSSFAPKEKLSPRPANVMSDEQKANPAGADEPGKKFSEDEEELRLTSSLEGSAPNRYVIPLPQRLHADVHYRVDGSVSGTLVLEESVFGIDPVRTDLMKQSVNYIRNKIRGMRKSKTKTISEVSGSGRKVRQQKGSGKARAGHSRPAHWRGGAKAHGPKNATNYGNVKMNKKAKRLAMTSALSQKLKEGNLVIVDNLLLDTHKTQPWASLLGNVYGIGGTAASALVVDSYHEEDGNSENTDTVHTSHNGVPINLWVATANIPKVKVVNPIFVNVYEIMKKEKLMMTLSALKVLEDGLKS